MEDTTTPTTKEVTITIEVTITTTRVRMTTMVKKGLE